MKVCTLAPASVPQAKTPEELVSIVLQETSPEKVMVPEEVIPVRPEATPAPVTSQVLLLMTTLSPLSPKLTTPLAVKVPLAVIVPEAVRAAAVIVPVSVGDALITTLPVPVMALETKFLDASVKTAWEAVRPEKLIVPEEVIPVAPVMAPAPLISMEPEFRILPKVPVIKIPSVMVPAVSAICMALVRVPAPVCSISSPLVTVSLISRLSICCMVSKVPVVNESFKLAMTKALWVLASVVASLVKVIVKPSKAAAVAAVFQSRVWTVSAMAIAPLPVGSPMVFQVVPPPPKLAQVLVSVQPL